MPPPETFGELGSPGASLYGLVSSIPPFFLSAIFNYLVPVIRLLIRLLGTLTDNFRCAVDLPIRRLQMVAMRLRRHCVVSVHHAAILLGHADCLGFFVSRLERRAAGDLLLTHCGENSTLKAMVSAVAPLVLVACAAGFRISA